MRLWNNTSRRFETPTLRTQTIDRTEPLVSKLNRQYAFWIADLLTTQFLSCAKGYAYFGGFFP